MTCTHWYIYVFICFWMCWVFVAPCGLSLVAESGGYFLVAMHRLLIAVASHCSGFFCGAQALGAWASVVATCRISSCDLLFLGHAFFSSCSTGPLELWLMGPRVCRLSRCGTWNLLLHSMWNPPRPGIEPMSPALARGFLSSVPPGKSFSPWDFHFC